MVRSLVLILVASLSMSSRADGTLPNAPHIYVEGAASISVAPEFMTVTIRHEATDDSVEKAKALVDERSRRFLAACADMGIQSQDIYSTMLTVMPAFDYHEGRREPNGTEVGRGITVTLRDLDKYSQFIAAVMASQVDSIGHVTMGVMNEKELLGRAQTEALADARARAERLANAANAKLGKVYSISEFDLRSEESYQLHPERSLVAPSDRERRTYAALSNVSEANEPFSPGMIDATARVFVVFLLEK